MISSILIFISIFFLIYKSDPMINSAYTNFFSQINLLNYIKDNKSIEKVKKVEDLKQKDDKKNNTIIFHSSKDKKKINDLRSKGIKLNYVELDAYNRINLKKVFSIAYNYGIGSIIIEGGKTLTKSLLRDKLINEFYLFKSKKNLGKLGRNNISDLKKKLNYFFKKKENIETFLDGDKITRYY